ncbi:TPA: hypothetical protein MIQ82_01735 [Klebsiella pneumoniae]|nr:hypothetical protein [Klebsiella pneumoniae]HBY2285509.1 hypothetical protein [Klebsiella pneumoniae]
MRKMGRAELCRFYHHDHINNRLLTNASIIAQHFDYRRRPSARLNPIVNGTDPRYGCGYKKLYISSGTENDCHRRANRELDCGCPDHPAA